jgi:hypothetical protein
VIVDMDGNYLADDHVVLRRWRVTWQHQDLVKPTLELDRRALHSRRAHQP